MRGLTAPRQEPLIQTAARGLLWWRPLQSQLFNHFWEDMEKFGIHPGFGGAGCGQRQEGRFSYQARQLLCVRSCQWHAVIGQLFVTSTERDQIAHTGRGMLVRLRKKDGRNLSVWRERGTWDLSWRELSRALRSSLALWKESNPRVQRGETDVLEVRTIRASKRGICMGFLQTENTLAVAVIWNRSNGTGFATTAFALLEKAWASPDGSSEQDQNCCNAGAWRKGESAELIGVAGSSCEAYQRRAGFWDQRRWSHHRWRRINLRILWQNGCL